MAPLGARQTLILILFLVMAAGILVIFLWVLRSARHQQALSEVQARAYVLRGWWFRILLLLVIGALAVSFASLPYPWVVAAAQGSALPVKVIAHQFSFSMPARLPANRLIEFEVTSTDVNHGFGIYDAQGQLLGQVQAMPSYVNRLYFTFPHPGTYVIRCLEYCGIAHDAMRKTITAVSSSP
ncbi:MAG: cytochrome C oxidase subunit II [Chloroflexi bacterium]|nr:cytochrome C oxidase subunit II [Chloroflexota bacterium]